MRPSVCRHPWPRLDSRPLLPVPNEARRPPRARLRVCASAAPSCGPNGGSTRRMTQPLRSEQFEALLKRLGPDREAAGIRYEELRHRLLTVFEYRRCHDPEKLADQTLDIVARRLQELGGDFVGNDPAQYTFGV